MAYYFVIVGKNDTPIFECDFGIESEKVSGDVEVGSFLGSAK